MGQAWRADRAGLGRALALQDVTRWLRGAQGHFSGARGDRHLEWRLHPADPGLAQRGSTVLPALRGQSVA